MLKELIRKEFFKLKNNGFSYSKCRAIIKARFEYEVSIRTLKRWIKRLDQGNWDLQDCSRKPKRVHHKINEQIEQEVINLRNKTGWGQDKLCFELNHLNVSASSIKRILKKHNLCRKVKLRGKRVKWVRWERKHPNSLWQIDHTDELDKFNSYTLSILDDCSRYSLAIIKLSNVTTSIVTKILDDLIKIHGRPREILTDNGGAYGLNSKHSKFDRWCRRRGIIHIRTKIHSPTTNGKVERLFKTMDNELDYCSNDLDFFRMRYNHFRPHGSLNGKTPADIYFR